MAPKKPEHVIVMAFPYGTHAMPLFNLVRRLAIQAPSLTFSFFTTSTSKSNQSVFGTSSDNIPSNIKSYDVDDGVPKYFTGHHMSEMIFFLKSMVENYKNGIHLVYGDEMKMIKCFICDSFMYFGSDMADELGVPLISFWTAGPCSLSTHFYTDLIRQSITLGLDGIEGREDELIDFVQGLSLIRIRDLQEGIIFGGLKSEFSIMLHKMGLAFSRAAAVTMNSFPELDLPIIEDFKSKFQKCLTLGPFTLTSISSSHIHDDPNGYLTWLDKQNPTSVDYTSFGTMTTPPPHELAALAEGLEESGVPFLWSLKDHLVGQFPDGFIVPWTPQQRVLGHHEVGVFVIHCVCNSVMENITSGVPVIFRPLVPKMECLLRTERWNVY
ncbi:hypothetical protein MKX03_018253 [Papaver bracteatum]|nr:hypothetical protein MKX03_018253 [Papaver bracteatum]